MQAVQIEEWAQAFINARAQGEAKPVMSTRFPEANFDDAYAVQRSLVSSLAESVAISGFKAAVSSRAAQQVQGLDGPLYGVLFETGELREGEPVDSGRFRQCMLETEIGYRVLQAIDEVPSVVDLQEMVTPIPMLEFADLGYDPNAKMRPLDLVAGNAASASYMAGSVSEPQVPNDVSVRLSLDGEQLFEGQGTDAMEDQQFAVHWLVERVLSAGYGIKPGQYLMTGSLGRPQPLVPGSYLADFGQFGQIAFDVD